MKINPINWRLQTSGVPAYNNAKSIPHNMLTPPEIIKRNGSFMQNAAPKKPKKAANRIISFSPIEIEVDGAGVGVGVDVGDGVGVVVVITLYCPIRLVNAAQPPTFVTPS